MRADVKITLFPHAEKGSAHGFGPGTCQLLEHIHHTGSIFEAAKIMGMAYSKAWRLLKQTETDFDCQLLDRNRRGGSKLTSAAFHLIATYHQTVDTASKTAADILDQIEETHEQNNKTE